jgi:hypothetical protein
MVGGEYLVIAFFFGLAGGVVGKLKGSSFWLWFAGLAIVPGPRTRRGGPVPRGERRTAQAVPALREDGQALRRHVHACGPSWTSPRSPSSRVRRGHTIA